MPKRSAFTLIEILVTVAVIGLLVSITVPSLAAARRQSKSTKCKYNLHQIGLAMQSYLHQNRDRFPHCARLPYVDPDLATLPEALARETGYKGTLGESYRNELFLCPDDRGHLGDDDQIRQNVPGRYYDAEGTSYEWESELNGLRLNFRTVTLEFDHPPLPPQSIPMNLRDMWMVRDFEGWHRKHPDQPKSVNTLYADMHIDSK